ncbi:LPXTG cell wall anchor domain-containing protein [Xylocopilactobacillus apicola]|uniref:Gram-positive cocci surface proteins LPxTG domain-containing protein n=1 Tax=Xylocopilactobacillus apicola TaxID=2932184 RepID=A0AAU9DB04_9LACO|nr:LPXTG cell wall anchor domain-containing protein [Xylocopilactobacillus apicola]BDR59615.1 hypothetical protein XA3_20560 [Xylocopilactobacillus apicola]
MIFTKKASIRMRKIIVAGTLVFGLTAFTVTKSSFAKSLLNDKDAQNVTGSYSTKNDDSTILVKVDNSKHYDQPKTDEVPKMPTGEGGVQVQNTSTGTLPQTSDGINTALPIIGATLIVGSFGLLVTKKKYDLL